MTAISTPTKLPGIPGPGEFKEVLYVCTVTAGSDTYAASGEFTTIYGIFSVLSTAVHTSLANTVSGTTITFAGYSSGTETQYVKVWGV